MLREFTAERPNLLWLTDITEHPTPEFQQLSQHLREVATMPGPKYTSDQKRQFFDLVDRGGTVRAAALTVGVRPDAAYPWLRDAGLTMRRRTPRTYTEAERGDFLRLLGELHNVRAGAAMLGFPTVTCYPWVHQAGIFTSRSRQ